MITARDLESIELFASFSEFDLERLAQKAADVHVAAGDYVAHEGENPSFWILLYGNVGIFKTHLGRIGAIPGNEKLGAGTFIGEVPIVLGTRQLVSIRANVACRLARFDATHFQRMVQDHPECYKLIKASVAERLASNRRAYKKMSATRVSLLSLPSDENTRRIRHFLNMSRVAYEEVGENHLAQTSDASGVEPKAMMIVDGHLVDTPELTIHVVAEALGMRTRPAKSHYDVVVIGGGPAGLASSVYGSSEGLDVLTVERFASGGQAGTSTRIENYLGFPEGVTGDDLAERAVRQAQRLGAEIVVTRQVNQIERLEDDTYQCSLDSGDVVVTKTIILATGVSWRCFQAEGIERLRGRGVSYGSAKMEAMRVVGKDVFIVGGGNSAGQAAVYFSNYAASVSILVRGQGLESTMSQYLIDQIAQIPNINVESLTQVVSVDGDEELERIATVTRSRSDEAGTFRDRKADALFILIGAKANTGWLPTEVLRDENGFVCTGQDMAVMSAWTESRPPFPLETSLPGFFCAGDVRFGSVKRVSASVGEGSMAINSIHKYLGLWRKKSHATIPKTPQYDRYVA